MDAGHFHLDNKAKTPKAGKIILVSLAIAGAFIAGLYITESTKEQILLSISEAKAQELKLLKDQIDRQRLRIQQIIAGQRALFGRVTGIDQREANYEQELDTGDWLTYTNIKNGFEVKYPSDWHFLSCMGDVQFFLYASGTPAEKCDAPKSSYDFMIISSSEKAPGNTEYAKSSKEVTVSGVTGVRFTDIPVGQVLEHPSRLVDGVVLFKGGTTYYIELSSKATKSVILESILSTFTLTK